MTDQLIAVDSTGTLEIERIAAEADVPCFRLSRAFLQDYSSKLDRGEETEINPKAHYVGDGYIHVNPEGARVAARAIAEEVRKRPELLP